MASKFKDEVKSKWPAGQLSLPAGGAAASSSAAPISLAPQRQFFTGPCADLWEDILVKSGTQWLAGSKLTQADADAVAELGNLRPNPATHPCLYSWAAMVAKFKPNVRSTWPAGELPRPAAPVQEVKAASAPVAAPAKQEKKEDEIDEDDLFGDNDDAPEPVKPKNLTIKKKAAPVAKSIILIDIKPWDETTDLDALAARVLKDVTMDGLMWKTEYKKEPLAYGVFKLVMGFVIEDEKVSVEGDIIEKLQEWEDAIQSVDIQSFNKL